MELESYVRSHTAHDIYCVNGETPETIMSGETSGISQFCELKWYGWIMFRYLVILFPENKMVLGRYLGPSIYVGPYMTAKIMKSNVEVVYWSKY